MKFLAENAISKPLSLHAKVAIAQRILVHDTLWYSAGDKTYAALNVAVIDDVTFVCVILL